MSLSMIALCIALGLLSWKFGQCYDIVQSDRGLLQIEAYKWLKVYFVLLLVFITTYFICAMAEL